MPNTPPPKRDLKTGNFGELGHEGWVGAMSHVFDNTARQGPNEELNKMKDILREIEKMDSRFGSLLTSSNTKQHDSMVSKYKKIIKDPLTEDPDKYRAKDRIRATVISSLPETKDLMPLLKELREKIAAEQTVESVPENQIKTKLVSAPGYQDLKIYFKLKTPNSTSKNIAKASRNQTFLKDELFEIILMTANCFAAKSGIQKLDDLIRLSKKTVNVAPFYKGGNARLFQRELKSIAGKGHNFYKMKGSMPSDPFYQNWHTEFENFYFKYFRTGNSVDKMKLEETLNELKTKLESDKEIVRANLSQPYINTMKKEITDMLAGLN